jgi:hypothetical protein
MSRHLNKWSLAIGRRPKNGLSIEFRPFSSKRAAKRAFRKEYEKDTKVLSVMLHAPIDKGLEPEKLK